MALRGKKHDKGKAANTLKPTSHLQSSQAVAQPAEEPRIPLELQQLMLNVFREALPIPADSNLRQIIQVVKSHLYNRDFASAFSAEQLLNVYALRWSASRALAYADIFVEFDVKHRWLGDRITNVPDQAQDPGLAQILCVGGAAGAEIVALAAIGNIFPMLQLSITAVDVADWSPVLSKLTATVTKPPVLSQYASAAKVDANRALIAPERFHVEFKQHDILECSVEQLRLLVAESSLVTIMFTLNELFSASTAKTTAFLLNLTEIMKPNSWLLVVDSPGSYSEVTLGKGNGPKRYPMKWLLDHTLQDLAGSEDNGIGKWKKQEADDSKWFRLDDKLRYHVELESMRYQFYVYQRQAEAQHPGGNVS
ncbi:hypothetical protein GJ744_003601 [Endocarpon pusillum]|uniref:25S rRNA (Uridine(2843)-N(3))-methyltransferase n=1 Tax=Endocarpon pusillum TaxID=364733 RepID=A0A8H7A7L4_9EURO|nr:hypothetical protein GJ744_003601 [Endocarpon pusillum]